MKYFSVAFLLTICVILYVWQNVEVMKMRMEYRKLNRASQSLVVENDRLRFEMERYRRIEILEKRGAAQGMKKIVPGDVEVLVVKEK